jgi:hypothetical protein
MSFDKEEERERSIERRQMDVLDVFPPPPTTV